MIRAFIAIEVPDFIQKEIAFIQDRLRRAAASVKWVKPENIHLTLKFLGNIEPGWVDRILREMDHIAGDTERFTLYIKGIGCFPNMRNPRVIWVGVEDVEKRAASLQLRLDSSLESLGFPREERAFTPHLTIGRFKSPSGRKEILDEVHKLGIPSLGSLEAEEMILFQSELNPQGAIYTPLGRARFLSGNRCAEREGGHDEHRQEQGKGT